MRLVHVGAGALNQLPLDWAGNVRRIREAIAVARERGVRLLVLPEMCISGYGCEDAFVGPELNATCADLLAELLNDTEGMAVSFGLPVLHRGSVYNCAAFAVNGVLVGVAAKRDLAGDGVHYEPRWFKAWPRGARGTVELAGHRVPIGDFIFELDGVRLGFEICEEAWVPARTGALLADQGVDVVVNPSASHFAFGKAAIRDRLVLEGSRAFCAVYVFANLMGNESGRLIFDGGCRIASGGTMVARGPRLSFAEVTVTDAVVDLDQVRTHRARIASLRADPSDDDALVVSFDWGEPPELLARDAPGWDAEREHPQEIFSRAVALALHDYTRKSWSRGWVVSLSGGADSAAVTALCCLSNVLAAADLGLDALKLRYSYVPGAAEATDVDALNALMLTTAYQATQHSGDVTRNAAAGLAEAVGARHFEWSVDGAVAAYLGAVESALGRSLSWETDDVALQNIQARSRSPGIWILANVERKLLLATSNRSEAAVGYATMDGDTSGGLSPIAGIDKAFLRKWLRWMETEGLAESGPIPALRAVNVQQPTAELRPASAGQTDEEDLMPYPVLDAIERLAIRDKLGPISVWRRMKAAHPEASAVQVAAWVRRFFELWCRNQWKRERYAPSFHLDDENLDPKTWCRFPILSGGYRRELDALDVLAGRTS